MSINVKCNLHELMGYRDYIQFIWLKYYINDINACTGIFTIKSP